jgi:hypothetical protein
MTRRKPLTQNEDQESKPFSKKEFINSVIKRKQKNKFLSTNQEEYYNLLKENEIGETKGENTALNVTLRETQRKAFLDKGQAFIDAGKQAEAAGDELSGFVNGRKKKAQYKIAAEQYQKAVDHLGNIPGGLGGFSDDNNERKEFNDKLTEAKTLQTQVANKLK